MKIVDLKRTRSESFSIKVPRAGSMCGYDFKKFFTVPADINDFKLVFTKKAHPEAYEMTVSNQRKISMWGESWNDTTFKADGFEAPLVGGARTFFKRMIRDGHTYVRLEY